MTDAAQKPPLLYLAHRIPYPPDKGDKIRSWNQFRHLCDHWSVHLGAFIDDDSDWQFTDYLAGLAASVHFEPLNPRLAKLKSLRGLYDGRALTLAFYDAPAMKKYVEQVVATCAPVAAMGFSAATASFLLPLANNIPVLIDLCDSDAEKWSAYAQQSSFPMRQIYAREARRLAAFETDVINRTETAFAITGAESALFQRRPGLVKAPVVLGNGVDTDYFNPIAGFSRDLSGFPALTEGEEAIVFVGAMDYPPNIEAVTRFAAQVWPQLRARHPALEFWIVGSNPAGAVRALAGAPGIVVTGRVDDVRPFLARASLAIAPIEIARGIQNKVLEAMAMARPVVASPAAAEGIDASHGREIMIAHDDVAFGKQISAVLKNSGRARDMGAKARQFVLDRFGWSVMLEPLDQALSSIRQPVQPRENPAWSPDHRP